MATTLPSGKVSRAFLHRNIILIQSYLAENAPGFVPDYTAPRAFMYRQVQHVADYLRDNAPDGAPAYNHPGNVSRIFLHKTVQGIQDWLQDVEWDSGGGGEVAPVVQDVAIVGYPSEGVELMAIPVVTGDPAAAKTYQWQRAGAPIAGATDSTYTVVAADIDQTINCAVTASNTIGSDSGVSSIGATGLAAVAGVTAPEVTSVPVTGDPIEAGTLALDAFNLAYTAGEPAATSMALIWSADGAPVKIANVLGGDTTYSPTAADVGKVITATLYVYNSAGVGSGSSDPIGPIEALPEGAPSVTDAQVSGTVAVGETLTASATVDGDPAPAVSYQWMLASFGAPISQLYPNVVDTEASILLNYQLQGSAIYCQITATNDKAAVSTNTPNTVAVAAGTGEAPTVTGDLTVAGAGHIGSTASVDASAATISLGSPEATVTYQWETEKVELGVPNIIGTDPTYLIGDEVFRLYIWCNVTYENAFGRIEVKTDEVLATGTDIALSPAGPVTSGTELSLDFTDVSIVADPLPTATYQWQVSHTSATSGFSDIAGATGETFTTRAEDDGGWIRCRIAYQNALTDTGSTNSQSAAVSDL